MGSFYGTPIKAWDPMDTFRRDVEYGARCTQESIAARKEADSAIPV